MFIDRRLVSQFDFVLLGFALLIPLCGLIVLYSAGYDPEYGGLSLLGLPIAIKSQAFLRQFVFLSLGLGALLVGLTLSPHFLGKIAYPFYSLCIVLLVAVDLFGAIVNGSQRWLSLGGFNIQPAEPTKLAVILALGRYLASNPPPPGGYRLKHLFAPGFLIVLPAALIMGQPDLGTAMVVVSVGGAMVLFMGVRPKTLLMIALPVLLAVPIAWGSLHDYQKRRIMVLIDPEVDPRGSGYHINQSKIAVGSGAVFGKGYMQGTQTQLEFLPEHTTDFVFSVLAEEWGFVGCVTVLALYVAFIGRVLSMVGRSKDLFSGIVTVGIASLVFVHAVVNIGMVIGILPVVGLPLPLFSYGGSSVLSCMFAIGIVLGLDMRRLYYTARV